MTELTFTVYGVPQPQGSIRAFMPKGHTRPILTSTNAKLKPWRQEVAWAAKEAMTKEGISLAKRPTPVSLWVFFYFTRPKDKKYREVVYKTTKPDVDKLLRGLSDSLTGICYEDDSQISFVHVEKVFPIPDEEQEARTVITMDWP